MTLFTGAAMRLTVRVEFFTRDKAPSDQATQIRAAAFQNLAGFSKISIDNYKRKFINGCFP